MINSCFDNVPMKSIESIWKMLFIILVEKIGVYFLPKHGAGHFLNSDKISNGSKSLYEIFITTMNRRFFGK